MSNNTFPTIVAVVGSKRAAQRVVVGLMTGLNWTELVEILIGSHLKSMNFKININFNNALMVKT